MLEAAKIIGLFWAAMILTYGINDCVPSNLGARPALPIHSAATKNPATAG